MEQKLEKEIRVKVKELNTLLVKYQKDVRVEIGTIRLKKEVCLVKIRKSDNWVNGERINKRHFAVHPSYR